MIEFYEIDDSYMTYLHTNIDNKVLTHNRGTQARPFVAIKILLNNCQYYVPLSSPDKADYIIDKYGKKIVRSSNVPTIKRIFNGYESVSTYLGKLLFNNMIPVPSELVKKIDIESIADLNYKNLLRAEYKELRKTSNVLDIENRAKIVHNLKINNEPYPYVAATVDFLKLEKEYMKRITK